MAAIFPNILGTGFRLLNATTLAGLLANPQYSAEAGIVATPSGTQATSYQLRARQSRVITVATAADGVKLPPSYVGAEFVVINAAAANALQLFGTSPDTIDGVATATGVSIPASAIVRLTCTTKGAWRSDLANLVNNGTAQTIAGAKTFAVMPIIPVAAVTATGSIQSDAAPITTGFTLVGGANATKGVKLPTAVAGLQCIIKNDDGANAVLKIWPFSGDSINALGVDNSFSVAAKTSLILVAYDTTAWLSIPLLPS